MSINYFKFSVFSFKKVHWRYRNIKDKGFDQPARTAVVPNVFSLNLRYLECLFFPLVGQSLNGKIIWLSTDFSFWGRKIKRLIPFGFFEVV